MPRDRAQPATPDSPKELTPWRDRLKWVRRDAGHIVSLASLDDNPADGIRWAIGYLDARLNILDQKFDSILQFDSFAGLFGGGLLVTGLFAFVLSKQKSWDYWVPIIVALVFVLLLLGSVTVSLVNTYDRLDTKFFPVEYRRLDFPSYVTMLSDLTAKRLNQIRRARRFSFAAGAFVIVMSLLFVACAVYEYSMRHASNGS
jgi:hypothetical protein